MKDILTSDFGFTFDNSYLSLPPILYTLQSAKPVKAPEILVFNEDLANEMGLNGKALHTSAGASVLSGNHVVLGSTPFAQRYSGHQFGYFNHLGDGRALMLGEHLTPQGQRLDVHLKGSGPTPYSRRGDGRASLGPMLREYLISEAMAHLGVPTTRSLAVVRTGEEVYRELPYEGAILTRVASSHIRVGTFQFAASHSIETLEALFNYTLKRHYPQCQTSDNAPACLLFDFAKRQASLIAKWQSVGFVHGVMNTDNVTLSGETIDYGPCAFLDQYHPDTFFSAIDTSGRYRFKNQPLIGKWNLARFAETLLPLFKTDGERIANEALEYYDKVYASEWLSLMQRKIGFTTNQPEGLNLVEDLLLCMTNDQLDYHDTFLKLTLGHFGTSVTYPSDAFRNWHENWSKLSIDGETMRQSNPAIIPRNENVEHALGEWVNQGNDKPFRALAELLKTPFNYSQTHLEQGAPQKSWPKTYTTTCGT